MVARRRAEASSSRRDQMKRRYTPRVIAVRHLEIYREVLNRPS
jgi:hypothetical protein